MQGLVFARLKKNSILLKQCCNNSTIQALTIETIMKRLTYYYWIFILILQIVLIVRKIQNEDIYIWNVVALVSAVFFLYSRLIKNKVYQSSEIAMALLIAVNGITTAIAQIISLNSLITLLVSLAVAGLSAFMANFIWKQQGKA